MKKAYLFCAVLLAFVIAMPAVSFGAAVQSRWDMTIGGYVLFETAWASQGQGVDYFNAIRASKTNDNRDDEFGGYAFNSAQTTMNYTIKGPDTFGAKTMAFIEGRFQGSVTGGNTPNGTFTLRHAYMKFDWAQDSLLLGQWWSIEHYGIGNWVVANNTETVFKAVRMPQVMWEHRFNPQVWSRLALTYTGKIGGTNGGQTYSDDFTRTYLPALQGALQYETKSCGVIGPRGLILGVGGVYAMEKKTWDKDPTAAVKYDSENVKSWAAMVWSHIPIIPEKNQNKTGALAFIAGATAGSNATQYIGGSFGGATYNRNLSATGAIDPSWAAPTGYGWYASMEWYVTNEIAIIPSFTAWRMANASNAYQNVIAPNNLTRDDTYNLAIRYDVNPAVRMAVEFMHDYAKYGDYAGGLDNRGKLNAARFSAWYFF